MGSGRARFPDEPDAAERLALLEYLSERGATSEQLVEAHRRQLARVGRRVGDAGTMAMATVRESRSQRCPGPTVLRALAGGRHPARPDTEVPAVVQLPRRLRAGRGAHGRGGDPGLHPRARCSRHQRRRVRHRAVLRRVRSGHRARGPRRARPRPDLRGSDESLHRRARRARGTWSWTRSSAPSGGCRTRGRWADPSPATSSGRGGDRGGGLGFVDLVGSTPWAESLDLRDQSLALTRFESAAWSSAVLAGGRVVKTIGDEVFFAAPSADAACRIGLEVCKAAAADHDLPPARGAVGIRPRRPARGRLLRAAGQSPRPPRQGRRRRARSS